MPDPLPEDKENVDPGMIDDSNKKEPTQKKCRREAWRHAFSMNTEADEYNEDDMKLIERVANEIVKRQMAVPALLFLESIKPITFLGSQVLVFFRPFVVAATYGKSANYERFALLMEKREGVERFIEMIENLENKRMDEIRAKKKSTRNK